MTRSWRLLDVAVLTILTLVAIRGQAQTGFGNACDLGITVSCSTNSAGAQCTSTTTNNGSSACSGILFTGFELLGGGSLSNVTSTLSGSECLVLPAETTVPIGDCFTETGSLAPQASITAMASVSGATSPQVLAFTGAFDSTESMLSTLVYAFVNAPVATCTPSLSAPSIAQSGETYTVSWSNVSNPSTTFQIDESVSPDFLTVDSSSTVNGTSTTFVHSGPTTIYYYRVRATSCNGGPGPYSVTGLTVVQAPLVVTAPRNVDTVVPLGSTQKFSFQLIIPPPKGSTGTGKTTLDTGTSYTSSTDKAYLVVSPASGTIPPSGVTLTVTANPTALPAGANTGTVNVTTSAGNNATPVSVSLATPVTSGVKTLPPPNALIIPVVTHVNSASGPFQSDVRLTNGGSSSLTYQVTLTPTMTDATKSGKTTPITVAPGQTLALNDIVNDIFGLGATGLSTDTGFGALEIRPVSSSSILNYASSRTFVTGPAGTYGQFVAAVPFSQFLGPGAVPFNPLGGSPGVTTSVISLQQVSDSAKFRTNLGIVEGSGQPANGRIRVIDDLGNVLKEVPYSLLPGEQQQLNRFIPVNAGIATLDDGRIEVTVDSTTGAVSAYASVLDNITGDPFCVMPVQASKVSATRYVVPGIAELVSSFSNFHSDMRVYNAGATAQTVNLTFYPQGGGTPVTSAPISLPAGQVKVFDNVLPSVFNLASGGGSVLLTTNNPSSLVATARTYSINANSGTFGQFIPGVMPAQSISSGDNALQILQLEESADFRSNVGIVETSGNPAHVRLTVVPPDSSKTESIFETDLQPNEFQQYHLISSIYGSSVVMYNARVFVEVTGLPAGTPAGTPVGRVSAYASVIDNSSSDPTYVPAQ